MIYAADRLIFVWQAHRLPSFNSARSEPDWH
jgi:hypothetical protein